MLRNPALEFGAPTSFDSALGRLPTDTHPEAANWEGDIGHLLALRHVLERAMRGDKEELFGRMVPLTESDIQLMERWSFRRALPPIYQSVCKSFIQASNYWSLIYIQDYRDQDYGDWTIHSLHPSFPRDYLPKFQLVSIRFKGDTTDEFPYNVGPVTPAELTVLLREIKRFDQIDQDEI